MAFTIAHSTRQHGRVDFARTGVFWGRWVLANAFGELAGLGTVGLTAWTFLAALGGQQTLLQHIVFAVAMVAAGAFEGAVVGTAQAWLLAPRLPGMPAWEWVRATILGSFVAWILGMLPSTLMAAATESSGPPPPEPGVAAGYGLAALLGVAAGLILSLFQWRVLRCHLSGARGWLAANAAAWALGMPLVFLGADLASRSGAGLAAVSTVAATLFITGSVVGAVHGLWLVCKLPSAQPGEDGSKEDLS